MVQCPIIREEIDEAECACIQSEAVKDGKGGQAAVAKKYKRIVGWKAICKTCKYHNKGTGKKK
ncbi:MAG: hypothetical protein J6B85_01370 [Lachnospiraceae bacterium]|nr:hypothetical protein [Lachnospiraceae bacterium]